MAVPTYQELATLSESSPFLNRLSIGVVLYARYIINEDPGTQNHNHRVSWAKQAILSPLTEVSRLAKAVAIDNIFASQNPLNLATTPDSGVGSLQAALEATISATIFEF